MKSFNEFVTGQETSLDESQDYQQVKDTIDKEVKRMRGNLLEDAKMLSRIADAMADNQYDRKRIKLVKDAEKAMDDARKMLTQL